MMAGPPAAPRRPVSPGEVAQSPPDDHTSHMKRTASVVELKARLSEYLRLVKAGGELVVTERGVPIARMMPLDEHDRKSTRRLRLSRAVAESTSAPPMCRAGQRPSCERTARRAASQRACISGGGSNIVE